MSTTYTVTAARDGRWWTVAVPGVGVTQARRLSRVTAEARDLISVSLGLPGDDFELVISMEVDDARQRFEQVVDLAQTVDVVLERRGHPAAVLVGRSRYDELMAALEGVKATENDPTDQAGEVAVDAVRGMRSRDQETSQARLDRIDVAVESSRGRDVGAVTAELLRGTGFAD